MDQRRNKAFGAWGEEAACFFLHRQGFRVIDRNFQTTAGEIDIVARKGEDYYFVEVKTRHVGALANDLAVTKAKLHKFSKTVKAYCYRKNVTEGSFIMAGLIVTVDEGVGKAQFRLAVYC